MPPFRYLDLPAEIRLHIMRCVLEHNSRGYHADLADRTPWVPIPSPQWYTEQLFLQPFDWAYGGLRSCSRQVAADLAAALKVLRANAPRTERGLDMCWPTAPAWDGGTCYATWTGPAWATVSPNDLDVEVRVGGRVLGHYRKGREFADGDAGVWRGSNAHCWKQAALLGVTFRRYGPRLCWDQAYLRAW